MATGSTKLYASQENGFKSTVSIDELGDVVAPRATQSVAGLVRVAPNVNALNSVGPGTPAGTIVDVTSAFSETILNANFASLATELNAVIAALKTAGLMTTAA